MNGSATTRCDLLLSPGVSRNRPLHSRVPVRDEDGRLLGDFMVLVSGLRRWPGARQRGAIDAMGGVLSGFAEVVFADLNLPLGLLWVSVKPRPGVVVEIYSALKDLIPEAKLVGPYTSPDD